MPISKDGHARRLGKDDLAGAIIGQTAGSLGHIIETGQQFGFGSIHFEVGDMREPLGHVGPLAENQFTIITDADEPLHVQRYWTTSGQQFEQLQVNLSGDDGRCHINLGLQIRYVFWTKWPGKAQWLTDAPFHVSGIVKVRDSSSFRCRCGKNQYPFILQFIQERKIVRVQAGDHSDSHAQSAQCDTSVIDGSSGCDFALTVNHQTVLRKVTDHHDI